MNVLVTGAYGQLGLEIQEIAKNYNYNFFFEGSKSLDITQYYEVEKYILKKNINIVINCAAYTSVDDAEEEITKATSVNFDGVKNIVESLKQVNGKLIQISTDYVFDGKKTSPYTEEDETNPINVYGKTKLLAEQYIQNTKIDSVIIRTSWLYSSYGKNFVKTIIKLAKEKDNLKVIADQFGSPTYAKDLALVCMKFLTKDLNKSKNIYHYSNQGVVSWYEFSKKIINLTNYSCTIFPIKSIEYISKAKRPKYSVLDNSKINNIIPKKYWIDSLSECIKKLNL